MIVQWFLTLIKNFTIYIKSDETFHIQFLYLISSTQQRFSVFKRFIFMNKYIKTAVLRYRKPVHITFFIINSEIFWKYYCWRQVDSSQQKF